MSSGQDHALASSALAPITFGVTFILQHNVFNAVCVGAGAVLGLFLSPDLDVDGVTYAEMILPWPIRGLFRAWWWPYAKLIPHRHWLSHMPVISTIVRILYAFWWFAFFDAHLFVVLLPVWLGLALSDFAHWLMDHKH